MLAYTSQPDEEVMAMCPAVTYTPYDTYSREQPGNIITFAQFEEGNLLSETRNNAESSDKYDDDSTMSPLIIKEEMDTMSSGYEYDDEPISTKVLEYIRGGIKSHLGVNRIEERYKIRDCI